MAIVTTASWINDDGLPIWFGLDEAILAKVTEYTTDGPERMIEVAFDAKKFNATDDYVASERVSLPVGAQITRAAIGAYNEVFASSGSGTVSVGLIDSDFASNLAATAIIATASVTELNGGGTGNNGAAKAGAGDGASVMAAKSTKVRFITISVDTAVFQTGVGVVYIFYTVPKDNETETLVYSK